MATVLYTIFISPLELVLEVLFELIFRILKSQPKYVGFAIIGVSIAVSLLSLPLYRRADILQKKAREKQKQMEKWISHIKRTFRGNERFMMLQQYYKLNNYSPLSALECAIPLLLQIPFFTAAYHFLSHLEVLKGAFFWIFKDLGSPDCLFHIGAFSINILPILMTAFNCISAVLYLKGFSFRDKFQTYGMAAIFLVLLYKSPSGLVLYWTCNNIFSLVKNIFYKLKHPRETAYILSATIGTLLTASVFLSGLLNSRKKLIAILVFLFITALPLVCYLAKNYINAVKKRTAILLGSDNSTSFGLFFLAGIFLTLLLGVLIPSSVIASSPAEFVNLQDYHNPFLFLINSTCYAIGFFLVWMGIVRHMLPQSTKSVLNMLLWVISGVCLLNYMCFGRHLGILSTLLVFEKPIIFSKAEILLNLAVVLGLIIIFIIVFRFKKFVLFAYSIFIICIISISTLQICSGQKILNDMAYIKTHSSKEIEPKFSLSQKGKNVIVFMLDRALSAYVPYLFEEKPYLKEQFDGFSYYPNTLSFGLFTNYGAPPLFGGYEYTIVEMNKRASELLADKHNESLKVLPVLFDKKGFAVSVCDPPWAGYKWAPDLSIFNDYPNIKAHVLNGYVGNDDLEKNIQEELLSQNKRNFFCYSIFKSLPMMVSWIFYDDGNYFSADRHISVKAPAFLRQYFTLTQLPRLTQITDNNTNTFLSIQNSTTHEPCILQLPDYEPKAIVNNSGYKTAIDKHFGIKKKVQAEYYHINMAAFLQLGKWFDFMRENRVYDNTRIIIVADHGISLGQFDYMILKDLNLDIGGFNPLLLVKDFNARGFITSNSFMTNADVPFLATKDIIDNPINPLTGKIISNEEKTAHPQIVTTSKFWDVYKNNGTTFDTSDGELLGVHDDIFNPDNW